MSRIAYILSAYKDAPHLARLIAALDADADFYIHIDRRASMCPFEEMQKALQQKTTGKISFVPRHRVGWGGWNQVEYQKELLAAVLASGIEYDRVMCLSGQDFPLWTNAAIHSYFEANKHREFIMGMNLTHCADARQQSKIVNYHLFRDLNWKSLWWRNKAIVVSRVLLRLLRFKKPAVVSIGGEAAEVYFGSDYWAISLPCARYVYQKLCTEKELVRYFKTCFAPSELCIQTLVFNSPFASRAFLHKGTYPGLSGLTPLHCIVYGKAIKIMTAQDLDLLQQSGKMFCRKVVSGVSDELVEAILSTRPQP